MTVIVTAARITAICVLMAAGSLAAQMPPPVKSPVAGVAPKPVIGVPPPERNPFVPVHDTRAADAAMDLRLQAMLTRLAALESAKAVGAVGLNGGMVAPEDPAIALRRDFEAKRDGRIAAVRFIGCIDGQPHFTTVAGYVAPAPAGAKEAAGAGAKEAQAAAALLKPGFSSGLSRADIDYALSSEKLPRCR